MNLSFRIARRYLFARRSTNAIHIISGIAMFGIAIGTAALILILSVFNGFEDLFLGMFNQFNPDVMVVPASGKTFEPDSTMLARLKQLDGVALLSKTLEEKALFDYKGVQKIGMLKGVDAEYVKVTGVDSTLREGSYQLRNGEVECAIVGQGIRNQLGIDVEDPLHPLLIYMPKRKKSTTMLDTRPFTSRQAIPVGTFLVQQDFEHQYVLASLELAQGLLSRPNAVSALEIKLYPGFANASTYQEIADVVGKELKVKNRYEQEASFLKLMRVEKWLSFAIVGLMLLLVSFNMIGALWMVVLEKQKDVAILQTMGFTPGQVYRVFLLQGVLMTLLGIGIGFALAILLYILQTTVGIISIPGGMLITEYPVSLRWYDFPMVALLVLVIGSLAAVLPARRARRMKAIIHAT